MLKYLFLCGFFAFGLYWVEPHVRVMRETVSWLNWLPAYDAAFWGYLGVALMIGTVITGLIFLAKTALYMWREMSD
ncbi:hypothetical protein [Pseudoroseomonas ludipueritiae]|uniref:Uncharacterized protein n=1 Tax=Pseudoroseomonas ludipueritiae TaxID=198093 RepID=A0ABR7R140_9PROT|nr:hypothetical protein [Pseudoroseomonas ludipueritiae]MBC9175449.1 hypothetical protein [Pseudoroseomonas ludipueritiae]MCG7361413.1 hypothetical protein [Roseomonas sp. ACRSG]